MFSIPVPLMQRIMDYLTSKPFSEVNPLIAEIVKYNQKPTDDATPDQG